ncbi:MULTISPECIES: hypothetical protein [unclassified Ectothiorhodospira]|uniref:hypothetical protein n=1 Tax=unclassified Ectothiorhodospira TaxID=2684909 RepID=UPI001EE790FB|nr:MULTISPECIES: hypothetical protein [unclassified Ectothiorhodospira]MCG5516393.1 hypothetical protein [Ectothiorhodospira sp. 9100]MCG5519357.1 hypothetical protein [Ectothiorhodospira sp. 9905]
MKTAAEKQKSNGLQIRHVRPKDVFKIFFTTGTALAAFELLVSPHPHHAKTLGVFPAVQAGGLTTTPAEIYFISGLVLFGVFFLGSLSQFPKKGIYFGVAPSRGMNALAFIFIVGIVSSAFVGLFLGNDNILVFVRVNFFLLLALLFYSYRREVYSCRQYVILFASLVGVFYASIVVLEFFKYLPWLPSFLVYSNNSSDLWFGLYFTAFALIYSLSRLLTGKASLFYIIVFLLSLTALAIRITNKPVILSAFVGVLVVVLVAVSISKKSVLRFMVAASLFSFLSVALFSYGDFKANFYSTFAERFYKIELSNEQASEISFLQLIGLAEQIEFGTGADVSAGRFAIWSAYFLGGLEYPLISPNFGGDEPVAQSRGREFQRAAHNSIAHYAYHVGYPAAIALLLLIFWFLVFGWKKIKTMKRGRDDSEIVAFYAYTVSIIAVEMVGGPILSSPTFTWFFFSVLVVFLFSAENLGANAVFESKIRQSVAPSL